MFIRNLSAVVLFLGVLLHAGAGNSQMNDVQRELDNLRRRLEIGPQSDHPGEPAVEVRSPEAGVWRQLKTDMTEGEVEGLLGKPDRVESQPRTVRWHWDKRNPTGWVSFDSATLRVIEWRYF